mgnify:CR=1 FL=1
MIAIFIFSKHPKKRGAFGPTTRNACRCTCLVVTSDSFKRSIEYLYSLYLIEFNGISKNAIQWNWWAEKPPAMERESGRRQRQERRRGDRTYRPSTERAPRESRAFIDYFALGPRPLLGSLFHGCCCALLRFSWGASAGWSKAASRPSARSALRREC